MSKPLPQITCPKCHIVQGYRGQKECLSCGKRLNEWQIKSQLGIPGYEEAEN